MPGIKNFLVLCLAESALIHAAAVGVANQNTGNPNSVQCQNARDAAIAGTSTSHQILSNALQVAPQSDIQTLNAIQSAQSTLSTMQVFVSNLAISIAMSKPPNPNDIQRLSTGVSSALVDISRAQNTAAQNQGVVNVGGAALGVGFVTGQIAVITAEGPEVVSQQVSNSLGSPSQGFLAHATIQLASVQQSLQFSANCVGVNLRNNNNTQPAIPTNGTAVANGNTGNGNTGIVPANSNTPTGIAGNSIGARFRKLM